MKQKETKIIKLSLLKKKILNLNLKKKKVILCHGVFDVVHVGHIKHFMSAKKNGDYLIVSITADQFVNKGPGRPIFNHNLRAEVLSSLEMIDAVYINNEQTPINLIKTIKPHIYFKGPDYKKLNTDNTKNIHKEIIAIKKVGGKILFSNDITHSSSNLINSHFNNFNDHQKKFLKMISQKYSYQFINDSISKIKKLKTLLIGETIIDQYCFGDVLGKSGKETHLVMREDRKEDYLGGAAAVANHLSSFCQKINFLTFLGEKKEYQNFIKKNLKKNIKIDYILKKDSSTILKKRFIDNVSKNKLLGVYNLNDLKLQKEKKILLHKKIKKISKKNDLILISDYDHGLICKETAKVISSQKKFISLNAQVNASNYGYHSLRKYKKINTLIINENELRHELRDKVTNIEKLSFTLSKEFKIKNLIVTRGNKGALLVRGNTNFFLHCPAFATNVVDKVGAGDAMLAIISLCLKSKVPDDLSLFLGSLAGAAAVGNIGNSRFIEKKQLMRQVEFLIK